MDTHQAIYDAVRSKISNGDIGHAVQEAMRSFRIGDLAHNVAYEFKNAAVHAQEVEISRGKPSVIMKPKIYIDGNMWCALYGENLQDGAAGFGESPELAMKDFDNNWTATLLNQQPTSKER